MAKLTFIAGLAAGYVLGTRAGRQRYEQIARTSGKVWHSKPVQKQVANAKEAARTKAAPAVADIVADAAQSLGGKTPLGVADAARATGQRLRASRTITAETITATPEPQPGHTASPTTPTAQQNHWAGATPRPDDAA